MHPFNLLNQSQLKYRYIQRTTPNEQTISKKRTIQKLSNQP
jgi:hypothetical protein